MTQEGVQPFSSEKPPLAVLEAHQYTYPDVLALLPAVRHGCMHLQVMVETCTCAAVMRRDLSIRYHARMLSLHQLYCFRLVDFTFIHAFFHIPRIVWLANAHTAAQSARISYSRFQNSLDFATRSFESIESRKTS